MKKYITILAAAMLLVACGGGKQETKVRPLKTEVKGDLADYISIVDDSYIIKKEEGGLDDDWLINFKLKRKKEADITDSKVDFKLILVNDKGMPVMGNESFRMATGLLNSSSELNKFKSFLKNRTETEEWFTLNLNTFKKQYTEALPKDVTHFVIRTVVEDLKPVESDKQAEKTEIIKDIEYNKNNLLGDWTGAFGKNNVVITIKNISDGVISGANTVKQNTREIHGELTFDSNNPLVKAKLAEPGTHKYDGVFNIVFNLKDYTAKGNWLSNDKKLEHKFLLKKSGVKNITINDVNKEETYISDEDFEKLKQPINNLKENIKRIITLGYNTPKKLLKENEELLNWMKQFKSKNKKYANTKFTKKQEDNFFELIAEITLLMNNKTFGEILASYRMGLYVDKNTIDIDAELKRFEELSKKVINAVKPVKHKSKTEIEKHLLEKHSKLSSELFDCGMNLRKNMNLMSTKQSNQFKFLMLKNENLLK